MLNWFRRSSQSEPERIDFTAVPVDRAVALLRALGEAQFYLVLEDRVAPNLADMLNRARAQGLFERPESSFEVDEPDRGYTEIVRDATGDASDEQADLRIALARSYEEELDGFGPNFVPPDFWPLAATQAWTDMAFAHRLATSIARYWRPQALFLAEYAPPDQPNARPTARLAFPVVRFAPELFWLLIALAEPGRPRSRGYEAATAIQEVAAERASVPGWAGFWEQWLLREAMNQPEVADRLPVDLRRAVEALPLVRASERPVTGGTSRDPGTLRLDAEDWEAEMPAWFPN